MLKKAFSILLTSFALLMVASCSATLPMDATSNAIGPKVGEASATKFLIWFVDGGDHGIAHAAKNGGIRKISTVDYKINYALAIIGITKYTTIVTGE
ncbi:MAG: hypothetical protein GF344_00580 [Chitinivibrionales bacterium]|nr:hypothetical protein [Chitinivibrionales bacterium]MBD3355617.1 hypothetical protein [Chitinivibrionales bacterium]